MKTIAKLVSCLLMLSFPVFAWLSHSGILPGSAETHGWGGFGTFVFAVAGWILLLVMSKDGSHKMANVFSFVCGVLMILNAVVYTFLRTANLIGPVLVMDNSTFSAVLVAVIYYVLAIVGMFVMYVAIEDNNNGIV